MLRMLRTRLPRPVHLTLFALAVSTLAPLAFAQQASLSPAKRSQIEAAVSKFMSATHVPGLSIAVVENGETEWASGFGFADLENNAPASEHTLFRLGSISKSLTATGAMELVQQGKLGLDAPVQKYCPSFPQKSAPITTRLVMGHLAGIRHYKTNSQDDPEVGNTKHFDDPIQSGLDFFKNDPLLSAPGTEFHYSTQGYTLVGCAIEGASHEKFTDYMQKNVFQLAGMDHTVPDNRFTITPYRTRFYQKTESGTVENADFLDSSYKIPGGGYISSAEDMAQFEVAMLHNKLINAKTAELMWTPPKPTDGKPDKYALGWGTSNENGILYVGHNGGQQGCSTSFFLAPEKNAGVVVLSNMEDIPVSDLATEILGILLKGGEQRK